MSYGYARETFVNCLDTGHCQLPEPSLWCGYFILVIVTYTTYLINKCQHQVKAKQSSIAINNTSISYLVRVVAVAL